MARLTLAQARAALAETLQILDIEGSPELVATYNRALASSQRTLAMIEPWLIPARQSVQTLSAGRTIYRAPCAREGLSRIGVMQDGAICPTYLAPGIALDDMPATGAYGPRRYDIRQTQGVASVTGTGGTGYTDGAAVTFQAPADGYAATGVLRVTGGAITGVTITDPGAGYTSVPTVTAPGGNGATLTAVLGDSPALMLTPAPSFSGTLVIDYRDVAPMAMADTDVLIMDELAVVFAAAVSMAPSSGSPRASAIPGEAQAYLSGLRRAGRAGGSFQPGGSVRPNGMVYRNGRWWTSS